MLYHEVNSRMRTCTNEQALDGSPITMVRALMAAGPTERPSSATENCMQTSPTARVTLNLSMFC